MKNLSATDIKFNLDKWVANNGTGRYLNQDYILNPDSDYSVIENVGMQQVKKEIHEFIDVLVKNNKLETCLEIGLGIYGSSHFLWRSMFDKVISIEQDKQRVLNFRDKTSAYYKKFILNDSRSCFIYGSSQDPSSVEKIDKLLKGNKVDLLFIDGDHQYKSILCDWLLYNKFVDKGGIIAFHDCVSIVDNHGVPKFLKKIKSFNNNVKLHNIVHSSNFGISYYYNS